MPTPDNLMLRVVEYKDGNPAHIHLFSIVREYGENPSKAMNAIRGFENILDRQRPNTYRVMTPQEWKTQVQIETRWAARGVAYEFTALPVIEHENIWTFFPTIDFNPIEAMFCGAGK
ncbi:hypothetical protein MPK74_gp075 [Erwinia phage pEa_SNUABM_7]|uniref:Uncharacterized protein n=1 Tax=Erwinia phage pEa_SNUABM_7 TaxID=2866695 RepID=A0AAE7WS58_9CAUD|nr:hypothetical protein MPK74_gp075 [Erwinia phage pEa_SNUABM_7]QYW04743.1 hypothetical protein pEaSNUABM7_00075 [Erwinia phage pEa_SNUABM_7]